MTMRVQDIAMALSKISELFYRHCSSILRGAKQEDERYGGTGGERHLQSPYLLEISIFMDDCLRAMAHQWQGK